MEPAITLDASHPRALLRACPAYRPSPLRAVRHGERSIWVKDETHRMGLGAFKALGGVYAVARLIEARAGRAVAAEAFTGEEVKRVAREMTFVCASAGNHGMSVAAGARLFGARARIYLAETVAEDFARRLRDKGAEVVWSGETYEKSVAAAIADAEETGAVHLADGSWPGYSTPPRLVMEGYTVLAEELRESFESAGAWPSHVYLQAGVGGLAAAMAYMVRSSWAVQPELIVVEPDAAPCLGESVAAGGLRTVAGPVSTMGRLDCKTPSLLALEVLRTRADAYVTVSDGQAADAVAAAREMGFATTPSGAAGLAACLAGAAPSPLVILSEGAVAGG
ncbi:MAG: pyridoxal-phosphate dependent enzyme [Pseudomonadota bacterium]